MISSDHSHSQNDTSSTLKQMTQELLDAIAPGNTAPWLKYVDARFVHMDENGVVRNKDELVKELQPLPAGLAGRIEIDKFQATDHSNTAVTAYEIQEYLDYHGQQLRTRFRTVDTWLSTKDGWRLIAEHTAAVLKDPPAITLSPAELNEYAGVYELTPAIRTTIKSENDGLTSAREDRPVVKYSAEVRDVFFAAGQPRSRRIFTRDAAQKVVGFVDRREGEDIKWRRVQ
jgi:hypothetical protein